jgi:CcmD family protein
MRHRRTAIIFLYALAVVVAYMRPLQAQQPATQPGSALTTVMLVVLAIWLGLALYLFSIDRSIRRLERRDDER